MVLNKSISKQSNTGLSTRAAVFKMYMEGHLKKNEGKKFGQRGKGKLFNLVDKMDLQERNVCILLEEDGNPKLGLVGLHHLFCNEDKQLIGFRGQNFDDPVIISMGNLTGPPGGLEGVEEQDRYDESKCINSLPGSDDLMAADSVQQFVTENPAILLSPRELNKARSSIDQSIIIDPYLFGQLQEVFGPDPGSINPVDALFFLRFSCTTDHKHDRLISFLWASASGYNDRDTLVKLKRAPMGVKVGTFKAAYQGWLEKYQFNVSSPPVLDDAMVELPPKFPANAGPPAAPQELIVPDEEGMEDEEPVEDEEIRCLGVRVEEEEEEEEELEEGEDKEENQGTDQGRNQGSDEDQGRDQGSDEEQDAEKGNEDYMEELQDRMDMDPVDPPSDPSSSESDSDLSDPPSDSEDDSSDDSDTDTSDSSVEYSVGDTNSTKKRKRKRHAKLKRKDKKRRRKDKQRARKKKQVAKRRKYLDNQRAKHLKSREKDRRRRTVEKERLAREKIRLLANEKIASARMLANERSMRQNHREAQATSAKIATSMHNTAKALADNITNQAMLQTSAMKAQESTIKEREEKARDKSATKTMTDLQLMVMKLGFAPVSALTQSPPLNTLDLKFTELHEKLIRRTGSVVLNNQLLNLTTSWECRIDLGSVGQFLSIDGFAPPAKDAFGGFTIFMFNPTTHDPTEEEMMGRLESLVQDPKSLGKEWGTILKRFKYYFPKTVDEMDHMITAAVDLLCLLSGNNESIAAKGYIDAAVAVKAHRLDFKHQQVKDPAFLTKVLYLIEVEQQRVYKQLEATYLAEPIFPLVRLQHLVTQRSIAFNSLMPMLCGPIQYTVLLPAILSTRLAGPKAPAAAKSQKKKAASPAPTEKSRGYKSWWKTKPVNDSVNWSIPSGKSYSDYFNDSDKGRANTAKIENLQFGHHKDEANPRPLCPTYMAEGTCDPKCHNAHIYRNRLQTKSPSLATKVDNTFADIYK